MTGWAEYATRALMREGPAADEARSRALLWARVLGPACRGYQEESATEGMRAALRYDRAAGAVAEREDELHAAWVLGGAEAVQPIVAAIIEGVREDDARRWKEHHDRRR